MTGFLRVSLIVLMRSSLCRLIAVNELLGSAFKEDLLESFSKRLRCKFMKILRFVACRRVELLIPKGCAWIHAAVVPWHPTCGLLMTDDYWPYEISTGIGRNWSCSWRRFLADKSRFMDRGGPFLSMNLDSETPDYKGYLLFQMPSLWA